MVEPSYVISIGAPRSMTSVQFIRFDLIMVVALLSIMITTHDITSFGILYGFAMAALSVSISTH
jgi:hypothetical protein